MGSTNVPNKKERRNEKDNPTSANMQTILTGRGIEVPENTEKGKTHDLGPTEYDINLGSIELVASTCELGKDNILRDANADVIVIDPEKEYSPIIKALGGEVIKISATSSNHINAMDMNSEYGDGANPIILKSEFILSLCEQLIGSNNLGAKQKSIIDRCTAQTYKYYQQGNYQGTPPTLQDFYEQLLRQSEPEAKEIALAIELFVNGSLNTFAKPTNVDTNNRLICYDILDLGKQLLPIGMLVVLDSILNRITMNRAKGRNTFIFIDEIYLLFQHEYSANFLFTLWKRVRKYRSVCHRNHAKCGRYVTKSYC